MRLPPDAGRPRRTGGQAAVPSTGRRSPHCYGVRQRRGSGHSPLWLHRLPGRSDKAGGAGPVQPAGCEAGYQRKPGHPALRLRGRLPHLRRAVPGGVVGRAGEWVYHRYLRYHSVADHGKRQGGHRWRARWGSAGGLHFGQRGGNGVDRCAGEGQGSERQALGHGAAQSLPL